MRRQVGLSHSHACESMDFGIVGLGNHAINRFMPGVVASGNSVTAVYSRKLGKAMKVAEKYDADPFVSLDKMLESKCEAVYVASPNALHHEQTKKALENGKHVLLEKPMTLEYDDALDLVATAKKNNLTLAVGFHLRFHPAVEYVKELLSGEKVGNINYVSGRWGGFSTRSGDPDTLWWSQEELAGGGSIMGTGVHVMDTFNNILGAPPDQVSSMRIPAKGVVDSMSSISLRYGETIGSAVSSRRMFLPENTLTVFGDEGTIVATNLFSTQINSSVYLNGKVSKRFSAGNVYKKEAKGFVDLVAGRSSPIASGIDGSFVVKMTQAAIASEMTGAIIDLDYKVR